MLMITCICFTTDRICSGAGGLLSWRQNVSLWFGYWLAFQLIHITYVKVLLHTLHYLIGVGRWWEGFWYLLFCTGFNNNDAELSENKAMDLVWLELSAKAVGWVCRRLWSWEVGRTDHLLYMRNVLRNIAYTIRWCHPSEAHLAVLHGCSPLHEEQMISVAPGSAQHLPRASLLQPLGLCWGGRTCWWQ